MLDIMDFNNILGTLKKFAFPSAAASNPASSNMPVAAYPGYQEAQARGGFNSPPETADVPAISSGIGNIGQNIASTIGNLFGGSQSTHSFRLTPEEMAKRDAGGDQMWEAKGWERGEDGVMRAQSPSPMASSRPVASASPIAKAVSSALGNSGNGTDLWDQFVEATRAEAGQRGYDADTIIKQKALESNFGRSNFATERNNFGGIGAYDRDPSKAFSFDNIQDYLKYYFDLVEQRYPDAYNNRTDPAKYVQGLKKGNYASDPDYEWKIANTPLYPR